MNEFHACVIACLVSRLSEFFDTGEFSVPDLDQDKFVERVNTNLVYFQASCKAKRKV